MYFFFFFLFVLSLLSLFSIFFFYFFLSIFLPSSVFLHLTRLFFFFSQFFFFFSFFFNLFFFSILSLDLLVPRFFLRHHFLLTLSAKYIFSFKQKKKKGLFSLKTKTPSVVFIKSNEGEGVARKKKLNGPEFHYPV